MDIKNNGNGMTNNEIIEIAKKLKLPNFHYYMQDEIPSRSSNKECGILNYDSSENSGTHHVCWWKNGKEIYYFDSFGIVDIPKRLKAYLGKNIISNSFKFQNYNETNCSERCLYVLDELNKGKHFVDILFHNINEKTF